MVSMRSLLAYFLADTPRVVYFVVCCGLVLLLAWKRRDSLSKSLRNYLVLPSIALLVLLLNPLVAHFLVTGYEETRSLRFFWLVPATLLLSVVTVLLVDCLPYRRIKILAAVAVPFVLLAFSNQFQGLRNTWENSFSNWYKVPPVVVRLDDWIMNDETEIAKTAVFPMPLNLWVRQYKPEIELPYEWTKVNWESEAAVQLYWAGKEKVVDLTNISQYAAQGGYNYIVLDSQGTYTGALRNYEEVYRVDTDPTQDSNAYDREYILYRLMEEE